MKYKYSEYFFYYFSTVTFIFLRLEKELKPWMAVSIISNWNDWKLLMNSIHTKFSIICNHWHDCLLMLQKLERLYSKVASSRPVYYSILNSLGQRSQYISIKLYYIGLFCFVKYLLQKGIWIFTNFKPFFLAAGGANPVDQAPSAPAVRQVVRQQPRGGGGGGGGGSPRVTATPKTVRQTPTVTARSQQQQNINNRIGEILSATSASEPPTGKDSNT